MAKRKCRSGKLGGAPDYHNGNARAWAANVREELPHINEAIDRGQCFRAFEGLLRLERKVTLAGTHAAQSGDDVLQTRVRKAMTDVVDAGQEFKMKCVRRS